MKTTYTTSHVDVAVTDETTIFTGRRKLVSITAYPTVATNTFTFRNTAGDTIVSFSMATNVSHIWHPAVPIDVEGMTVQLNAANTAHISVSTSRSY